MLAITGLIVWVLVQQLAGLEDFWEAAKSADPLWLAISLGIMVLAVVAAIFRLQMVLKAMGYPIPFLRATDAIMSTWPLALITPSRAGDLVRAWILRDLCPPMEGSGAVVVERMIDVQSLCLLTLFGSAMVGYWEAFGLALLILLAEWVFVFGIVLNRAYHKIPVIKKKAEKLDRFLHAFGVMRARPSAFLAVNVISIFAWMANVGIVYALLVSLDAGVSWMNTLASWPLALFAGLLPVTVGGMGTRDAGFVMALSLLGPVPEAKVLAASLGYAFVTLGIFSAVGLPFMLNKTVRAGSVRAR